MLLLMGEKPVTKRKITNFYPAMLRQPLFSNLTMGSRILLLVLVILLSGAVSLSLSYLISLVVWGNDIFMTSGDPATANIVFLRFVQMFNQLGFFLLPPLLYAWLSEQSPSDFLGFTRPAPFTLVLSLALILSVIPLMGELSRWNEQLDLPGWLSGIEKWMIDSEESAMELTLRFLGEPGVSSLLINLVMIALLPALGEELLFRSALLGIFRKMFRGIHWPVILSSVIFSALHLQFFGFLPRFMLGLVFGYLYLWSGSVWVPVSMHFVNNASVVIAAYLYNNNLSPIPAEEFGTTSSTLLIVSSFIICLVILFLIFRNSRKPDTLDNFS